MLRGNSRQCGGSNGPVVFVVAIIWLASLGAVLLVRNDSFKAEVGLLRHQHASSHDTHLQAQVQKVLELQARLSSQLDALAPRQPTSEAPAPSLLTAPPQAPLSPRFSSAVEFCPPWTGPGANDGTRVSTFVRYETLLQSSAADAAQFDDINCTWLPLREGTLISFQLLPKPVMLCAHDPKVDQTISASIQLSGLWFMLDFGRKAHERPFCTPERPFVIDVGVNLGMWGIHSLDAGCIVIGFEPLAWNIAKAHRTFQRQQLETLVGRAGTPRAILFKNGVSDVPGRITIAAALANPGTSQLSGDPVDARKGAVPSPPTWSASFAAPPEAVDVVTIDELFTDPALDWIVHPGTGERLSYRHVHTLKVDAEGFDLRVANGARRLLAEGQPSWLEFEIPLGELGRSHALMRGCNATAFFDFLYDLGYVYMPNEHEDFNILTRKGIHDFAALPSRIAMDGSWMHVNEVSSRYRYAVTPHPHGAFASPHP